MSDENQPTRELTHSEGLIEIRVTLEWLAARFSKVERQRDRSRERMGEMQTALGDMTEAFRRYMILHLQMQRPDLSRPQIVELLYREVAKGAKHVKQDREAGRPWRIEP